MTRVKRGSVARKYRKNILDSASGFRGAHSRLFRTAKQRREKALTCAHVDRNNRKRAFRRLWIARINAAARKDGITHSSAIHSLYENRISLNRKTLAQIAILDAYCFSMLVQQVSNKKI
uniref:ribosomal protein L20 n=1 Tax=Paragymnopteris bipinnata var. bipinnata TaxID=2875816 RepID=UPI001F14397D|nr:ribosomal protein L20 [Paragymnopteris bipinnata var. bipinnata]UAT96869.1 ribosomal protein L20 [Paragymnopteris bipinnata var. bipinnata]